MPKCGFILFKHAHSKDSYAKIGTFLAIQLACMAKDYF